MSNLRTDILLSTAATARTEWIDLRNATYTTLQVSVPDNASPVGAVTVEYSNDVNTIENEKAQQVLPANTQASRVNVTAALVVLGTAFAAGYDGAGAKASFTDLTLIGIPAFVRVIYTRTSGGGATDPLRVNVIAR